MLERTGYPPGVPCWIDLTQPDFDATTAFYGGLFDWTFDIRTPDDAPARYAYALLDGLIVAGINSPPSETDPSGWTSYVWVESADDTTAAVEANGGRVLSPPLDIPRAGRVALCADPEAAVFGVWQAAENRGVQAVNAPGSWVFSGLNTADPEGAEKFYGAVFGWVRSPFDFASGETGEFWRLPGYGDYLAERDPELRERQAADQAPGDFADAVAVLEPPGADGGSGTGAHWSVTFSVADADTAFARAVELGATVVTPLFDTEYTRAGTVRDPQGAELTLSEYRPPSSA
jgi:predicted enzyme related to lactoylglutathione lyase